MNNMKQELAWNMVKNIDKQYNNNIQFSRLLSEIESNIGFTETQKGNLCLAMDLEWSEIEKIFSRATEEFEKIQESLIKYV